MKMILQKHWVQNDPLTTLDNSYIVEELSSTMSDFITNGTYKNYYSNHVVIELYKNMARLFNKNTEEYIAIGFFNTDTQNVGRL